MDASTHTRPAATITGDPFPVGTSAWQEWHCGHCATGLVDEADHRRCEVCGCRYDSESGVYLGGGLTR